MSGRTYSEPKKKNSTAFSLIFGKKLSDRTSAPKSAHSGHDTINPRFGYNFGQVCVYADEPAGGPATEVEVPTLKIRPNIVQHDGRSETALKRLPQGVPHKGRKARTSGYKQQTTVVDAGQGAREQPTEPRGLPNRIARGNVATRSTTPSTAGPCNPDQTTAINAALERAREWRGQVRSWFETHLGHLREAPPVAGRARRARRAVVTELGLLDRHFRVRRLIERRGSIVPRSTGEWVDVRDLENFGNASSDIRRYFADVDLASLIFQCNNQSPCPRGRGGRKLGEAVPGSREFTIFAACFGGQPTTPRQVRTVIHESFHATFSEFDHDCYLSDSSYPGSSPVTNADSYENFAADVVLGRDRRELIQVEPMHITAQPSET